jgi:VanZ family protein
MLRQILKSFNWPPMIRWIILVMWMVVFLIYLLQSEAAPILSTGIPPGPYSPERDAFFTGIHLLAYTFTTLLWTWAISAHMTLRYTLIATFVIVLSMGFLTELGQTLTPDRHFQLIDLAANVSGLLLGLMIFGAAQAWTDQKSPVLN